MTDATNRNSAEFEFRTVPEAFDVASECAMFLRSDNTILIPRKTAAAVKYIPNGVLADIHPDLEVAREMCLYFLSMMTLAYFKDDRKIRLNAQLLQNIFRAPGNKVNTGDLTYLAIRKALLYGTSKVGAIIGFDNDFSTGTRSNTYYLTDSYKDTGFAKYEIGTDYLKKLSRRNYYEQLSRAAENLIARNLFRFYAEVTLLSVDEAIALGTKLAKAKFKTKKGKTLTMRHRKDKSYWKDADARTFVEDSVEQYAYLTESGLLVPTPGNERSGGRVVDSITLMASWIRAAATVDGKPVVELDFKALHPNLAMKLYGGNARYITHDNVADATGVSRTEVKVEHLSFFNRRWDGIERSPLYDYYTTTEPSMMEAMCRDKADNQHTATSRQMFALEVELMTEVIKRLNKLDVYVGYGYDAIYVSHLHAETAKSVMNLVANEMGVYTTTEDVKDIDTFIAACKKQIAAVETEATVQEMPARTMSADDFFNNTTIKQNGNTTQDSSAKEHGGGAEPSQQPQDTVHGEREPRDGDGDQPRPAASASAVAERPGHEPLALATGWLRAMADQSQQDVPRNMELQEELAGEHHEDGNDVWPTPGKDSSLHFLGGPGAPTDFDSFEDLVATHPDAADCGSQSFGGPVEAATKPVAKRKLTPHEYLFGEPAPKTYL